MRDRVVQPAAEEQRVLPCDAKASAPADDLRLQREHRPAAPPAGGAAAVRRRLLARGVEPAARLGASASASR
jgi:hypothetical protein